MQSVSPSTQRPINSAIDTPRPRSIFNEFAPNSRKPTQSQDVLSSLTLKLDKLLLNQQADGSIPLPKRFHQDIDEVQAADTFSRQSPSPVSEKTDKDLPGSPFQRSNAPTPDAITRPGSKTDSQSDSMAVDSPVDRPASPLRDSSRSDGNMTDRKKRKFSDALADEEGEPSVESPHARRKKLEPRAFRQLLQRWENT